MAKARKRRLGKRDAQTARQLAERQQRDALRRGVARQMEIDRLTKLLVRTRTRADESLEQLRDWLNRLAAEQFATRADPAQTRKADSSPVS